MDTFAFVPSLHGVMEESLLAFHHAGGGTAAPMPSPVVVMMAAMLRQPLLDLVRLENATTETASPDDNTPKSTVTSMKSLIRKGAVSAIKEKRIYSSTGWSQSLSDLDELLNECIIHRQPRCFFALVARYDEFTTAYERIPNLPFRESSWPVDILHSFPGVSADPAVKAMLAARKCVRCSEGSQVDTARLAAVAAAWSAPSDERDNVAGDVRTLLQVHKGSDATELFRHISQCLVRADEEGTPPSPRKAHTVVKALLQLDRPDMASAFFATLGPAAERVTYGPLQRAGRAQEIFTMLQRQEVPEGRSAVTDDASQPLFLMSAFDVAGDPTVRRAPTSCVAGLHIVIPSPPASTEQEASEVERAYHPRVVFLERWASITRGVLDGFDWTNCVASGGAVVRALTGTDDPSLDASFGDVDLFFYGLLRHELRRRVEDLIAQVRAKVGAGNYAVLLTTKTVTILVEGMPRVQVATGLWPTVDAVLGTVDVDCCGVGFTGTDVVMTGRAAAAYAVRANVCSASRHMVRGSIEYELRLWKYASRYGFAVIDPLHEAHDATLAKRREALESCFQGHPVVAAHRFAATSLTGLYWLMVVGSGLIRPTPKADDLSVGVKRTVRQVLETVTKKGYVPSDGYGCHESGYVAVIDDLDQPDAAARMNDVRTFASFRGDYGADIPRHVWRYETARMSELTCFLWFEVHDSHDLYRRHIDVDAWLLDRPTPTPPPRPKSSTAKKPPATKRADPVPPQKETANRFASLRR